MRDERALTLSAAHAAQQIRDGKLTSEELIQACLERIRALEPQVQAWTFLDEEHALAQARALDQHKRNGGALGPLHGVPVGIKDIIDTPTCRRRTAPCCTGDARPATTPAWSPPCAPPAR